MLAQQAVALPKTSLLGAWIMSTQQQVLGNWNELKGKIKETWGQLSDQELKQVEGQYDQLVGLIQRKTGQARQEIEQMVNRLNEEASGMIGQAATAARQYVDQAGERIRGATQHLRERTSEGYEHAEEMLRRRPAEAVATAFGAGLLVGLVVGIFAVGCTRSGKW
jgi:uncharacterized protein YjbJ (UPF0337 family)